MPAGNLRLAMLPPCQQLFPADNMLFATLAYMQPSPRRGIMQPAARRQPLPKPAFGSSPNLQVCARSQLAAVVPSLLLPAVCNRGNTCLLGNACKCSASTRGTFVCDRCRRICAAHRHLLWSLGSVLTPHMTALRRTVQQQQQLTAPFMRSPSQQSTSQSCSAACRTRW